MATRTARAVAARPARPRSIQPAPARLPGHACRMLRRGRGASEPEGARLALAAARPRPSSPQPAGPVSLRRTGRSQGKPARPRPCSARPSGPTRRVGAPPMRASPDPPRPRHPPLRTARPRQAAPLPRPARPGEDVDGGFEGVTASRLRAVTTVPARRAGIYCSRAYAVLRLCGAVGGEAERGAIGDGRVGCVGLVGSGSALRAGCGRKEPCRSGQERGSGL